MITGFRFVLWQKRTGMVAMVVLAAALLSLADALVGGFKGGHAFIELIPDSRFAISGPLPPRTEAIKDFVIEGLPADGSIRLVPEAIFSGYLFGGAMWRGAIVVGPHAREGSHVFSVKDKYGEKQNPTLVFKVRVWPDIAARNANSPSRLTRLTGRSPFHIALGFALLGLIAAAANFVLGRLWARHLAAFNCGEIYKVRRTPQGVEITCEIPCHAEVRTGMACTLYRPSGEALCAAKVSTCENGEVLMLVSEAECVRLGDVACVHLELPQSLTSS